MKNETENLDEVELSRARGVIQQAIDFVSEMDATPSLPSAGRAKVQKAIRKLCEAQDLIMEAEETPYKSKGVSTKGDGHFYGF